MSEAPTVGENLKRLRLRAGLTQVQLGTRLGIAGPTISGYESGDSQITADALPKFAAILGVHPGEFFGDAQPVQLWGDTFGEDFKALIGEKLDRLPPHEQHVVALAAGIVDTLLARAG